MTDSAVDDTLRTLAPQVLGALVRRYGRFDPAEDAVQEALLKAAQRWPEAGIPERPFGWLLQVASRKLIDLLRADQARRERELRAVREDAEEVGEQASDDTLVLLFLCCHPSLSVASQIALTLRAVGGLTTAEIARAFLTSEDSMTRRISRAKRTIQDSGVPFRMPPADTRGERLEAVLHVLYLIFTEGYSATSGPELRRADLVAEAIRLAEMTVALVPDDSEAAGLLALMVLTDARSPARVTDQGELVPLHEQDRTRWKAESIRRGVELLTAALPRGPVGPYQLQAAIAAVHDEAATAEETDWRQIVGLYRLLLKVSASPVAKVSHAVAVGMADGPAAGLELLDALDHRDRRFYAARAHLLERAGDREAARSAYLRAAELATNIRQVRYLHACARRLSEGAEHD
ncbi:RNA polymerase subunit sigma-24 [Amycolatopsis sp. AA4]|uniref:RNA polymerase sigma factor n=1 Tax=Actinomycetes TaxID=1760 RepID=UPI0001B580CC|nr:MULTISPECIES: sigma-70 family RNA polymerase sigma factor [Actinomycetes]ATY13832.1 RNA polymerase subunit sigma-24 [Amycolatopsis sp. AA4]EFL09833.1 RNA polymerase sigma-70 factor [Streptomyces sp. AA4]